VGEIRCERRPCPLSVLGGAGLTSWPRARTLDLCHKPASVDAAQACAPDASGGRRSRPCCRGPTASVSGRDAGYRATWPVRGPRCGRGRAALAHYWFCARKQELHRGGCQTPPPSRYVRACIGSTAWLVIACCSSTCRECSATSSRRRLRRGLTSSLWASCRRGTPSPRPSTVTPQVLSSCRSIIPRHEGRQRHCWRMRALTFASSRSTQMAAAGSYLTSSPDRHVSGRSRCTASWS
jgi:hypothetical protein